MSSNTKMDSFFNRIVGRLSHYNKKKRYSLQEASLAVNRDAVTSSDIMDIDWTLSRDDVIVNDDVTAKNLDNDRDSTQWKKSKKFQDNRKLSFGIFGKKDRDAQQQQHPRDSVVIQEESVLDRRPPKRFFSQQNLKAIPKDTEVCEGYSSRFHPSRFLWRFTSNQKIKSNPGDNCGSSLSLNQQKVEQLSSDVEYQSPVDRYPVDGSIRHWLSEDAGGDYQTEAAWKGGMERRSRCQSLSGLPEASAFVLDHQSSTSAVPNSSGSCCSQRTRPSVLGGEFCSTRCLGDYRPCLNTHYEEPTGGETEKQKSLNGRTHQKWTMQEVGAESADSYERKMETRQMETKQMETRQMETRQMETRQMETRQMETRQMEMRQMETRQMETRQRFGDLDLTWTEGPSKSTRIIEPDVHSKFRNFLEENGKSDLVATTTTGPAHFPIRSSLPASQQQIIERPSTTTTAIRSDATIRDKTALEQDSVESHARTMRRLSKDLYGEQSRTLPHSSVLTSPFKKPQIINGENNNNQAMNYFTVGRSNGFTNLPTKTFSPSTAKNPRSLFFGETSRGSVGSPGSLGYFHSRSLSMSQLQCATPSNTAHQWSIRDGYNAAGADTRITPGLSDSGIYDLIGENRRNFSDFNAETRPPSLPGVSHQRGGSLDSNEAGRLAYERGSLAPYAAGSRQTYNGIMTEDFTANRLGYNEDDHPPFRYDICQPQTSDGDLILAEKKNPVSASKQLQQQAMVSLFQKLSALKQQQKQQQQQLNGNSTGDSYEPTQPSSSNRLSSHQVVNSSGSLDKWKGLPHPTARPCHPVLNLLNRTTDISAKMTDIRSDALILENSDSRSKIPSQKCLVTESGQDLRKIKKGLYSEGIVSPRLSASQTEEGCKQSLSPPRSHPPPPPTPPSELPPKTAAAAAALRPDVGSSCYVDRLRQEARKQQTTSVAVAVGSARSNSEPNRLAAGGDRRRRSHDERRHSDGAELKKADIATTTDHQTSSFNNNNNNNDDNESNNKETKKVEISTDCLTTHRQHSWSLSDILKDLPDEGEEEAYSSEDGHFRSLSAVLCRHHPDDACRILTPVCVRAGASFVRRMLFEGLGSPPDFEDSFQAIVDVRPKDHDFRHGGDGSDETRKDSTISGDSLQTLKDELLALVEERFQRQTEKTEQMTQLHVRTLLLENKVIEFVREKIDSKQLEKFLSYLEQLEKVVQLFLNLSSRLSSVEESICQSQGGSSADDQREQKRYNDKRLQILLRLKEAMELKSSIDARSEQVCAHLSRHLTPTEFEDFRSLVRNRCQLLIQRQAIEDRKQLIVLQKKFLTDQNGQSNRAKTTGRTVDDSNLMTNEKIVYT